MAEVSVGLGVLFFAPKRRFMVAGVRESVLFVGELRLRRKILVSISSGA